MDVIINNKAKLDDKVLRSKTERVAPTGSHIKSGTKTSGTTTNGDHFSFTSFGGKIASSSGIDFSTTKGSQTKPSNGSSSIGNQAEISREGSNNSQGLIGKYQNNDDITDGYNQSVDTFGIESGTIQLNEDTSFNFISSGSEGFHKRLIDYLISLNKNKYGRQLLEGLANSVTKIFENFGQNATTERKWYNLNWNSSTVAFDAKDMASPVAFENRNGDLIHGLFYARNILAHELFHAWQNTGYLKSGAISLVGKGVPFELPSEVSAVRFVNQIRMYNLSQQFRVQYSIGGPRVDSYSEVVKRTTQH